MLVKIKGLYKSLLRQNLKMHGKIKHIKHGKIIQVKVKKMKFINLSYGQAYAKSSNDNTCKKKKPK